MLQSSFGRCRRSVIAAGLGEAVDLVVYQEEIIDLSRRRSRFSMQVMEARESGGGVSTVSIVLRRAEDTVAHTTDGERAKRELWQCVLQRWPTY